MRDLFPSACKIIHQPAPAYSFTLSSGKKKKKKVMGCKSLHCHLHFIPPFVSLIVSFSSTRLPDIPFQSSSSARASVSLGLASVGQFQSVCLLMTPLGADVMLSSCCSALQRSAQISLMLSFIYTYFCSLLQPRSTVNGRAKFLFSDVFCLL